MQLLQKIIIILFVSLSCDLIANELNLSSSGKKSIFIELFTSQGCSSCPPAEEYLNEFSNNKELWDKYIPIAFHVDYWDYIGWKDVFAKKEFAARQYRYAKLKHVRTVYTPAFIVNGNAWRKGFFSSLPRVQGLAGGLLQVKINNNQIKAVFKPSNFNDGRLAKKYNLNIALLGMDIIVKIRAGENEGRQSTHSFVVLGYHSKSSNDLSWQTFVPKNENIKSKKLALVAWVSRPEDPTPIQAVGGWLVGSEYF